MNKEDIILDIFKTSIKTVGRIKLVPHSVALSFIDECLKNNMAITGIDRFRVNTKTKPLEIADYSDYENDDWSEYIKELSDSAIAFINNFEEESDIYYEFVLISEEDLTK